MPSSGKEGRDFMERAVYAHLGRHSRATKVGPGVGFDNGVVSLGGGRVMIVTVDPVSAVPAFGMELSAWLSVHLVASDLTSSGVDPEFAIFSYNFPAAMTELQREGYVRSIGAECRKLGMAIIAGHTGAYPGGGYTVIGAGTMFGFASEGGYVTPAMARSGDSIMITKDAAIEATGSLALSFPEYVEERIGPRLAKRAKAMLKRSTTVEDARTAKRVGLGKGGVTSMHDATEGGVLGALEEMAAASGKSFVVEAARIPISPEAAAVTAAFGLDPLATMGEGALLLTCNPDMVGTVERALSRAGIEAREIGVVQEGAGLNARDEAGKPMIFRPGRDHYWSAYEDASRRGLR